MTNAPELKPCPFCGGDARIYQDTSHSTAWFCGCEDWDCFGNMMWDETKTGATDKWNRRADLSSPLGAVVKPLVWFEVEKSRHGGKYNADGYTIRYIEGLWLLDFAGNSKQAWRFPTIESAQAAAQADYTARILAALEPPTHAALLAHAMRLPEVAALREALDDMCIIAKQEGWDKSLSGRQLAYRNSCTTLAALEARYE